MTTTDNCRHFSIFITRPVASVAAFLGEPPNFPLWASGLSAGITRRGADWIGTASQGEVKIRFSPPNDFGVADHWVSLPSGQEVYVPLRALTHGAGCEVVLTLFRLPDMDDEDFARDAGWIARDLARLKVLLEK